jgi:hypothetical protein
LIKHELHVGNAGHLPKREIAIENGGAEEHVRQVGGAGQVRCIGGSDLQIGAAIEVIASVAKSEARAPLSNLHMQKENK